MIYCKETGRQAEPTQGKSDRYPVYKCFKHDRPKPKNIDANANKFRKIEDAAKFLLKYPKSGIRVAATGTGKNEKTAILSTTLVIERDA